MSDKKDDLNELDDLELTWVDEDKDAKSESGLSAISSRIKKGIPPAQRKGILYSIGALIVGGGLMILFAVLGSSEDDKQQVFAASISESDVPSTDPGSAPIYGTDSVEYQAIQRKEDAKFEEASENKESSIDNLEFFNAAQNLQNGAIEKTVDAEEESSYIRAVSGQEKMIQNAQNPDRAAVNGDYDKANLRIPYSFRQMVEDASVDHKSWSADIASMAATTKVNTRSSDAGNYTPPVERADANASTTTPLSNGSTPVGSVNGSDEIVQQEPQEYYYKINPTEIQWAILTSECNTDEPGILGEIISGPIKGSSLMGSCSLTPLKNVALQFDLAIYKNEAYSIDAIALDSQKFRQSIPADVDNHYFSRYVPFLLSKFAGAYAESLITTTQLDTNDTSVTQVTGIPDSSTQLKYAFGETLSALLPGLEAGLSRPPTGTVDRFKVFPILFRSEQIIN